MRSRVLPIPGSPSTLTQASLPASRGGQLLADGGQLDRPADEPLARSARLHRERTQGHAGSNGDRDSGCVRLIQAADLLRQWRVRSIPRR